MNIIHYFLHIYPLIAKAQVNAYAESASNGICTNHVSKYPFYAKPTLRMAHVASQAYAESWKIERTQSSAEVCQLKHSVSRNKQKRILSRTRNGKVNHNKLTFLEELTIGKFATENLGSLKNRV